MKCDEFCQRIAEMFDTTAPQRDMIEHLAQCPHCRRYYEECAITIDALTPRHAPATPPLQLHRKRPATRMLRRIATWAAVALVVVTAGTGIYLHTSTRSYAAGASQLIERAIESLRRVQDFTAHIEVRTRPNDNCDYVSPREEMVAHRLTVAFRGNRTIWRVDKASSMHIVNDGRMQYQWREASDKLFITDTASRSMGLLANLIDIEQLMEHEKALAQDNGNCTYHIEKQDSLTILTVKNSHPAASPTGEPYMLAHYASERVYTFNAATNLPVSLQYYVATPQGKCMVLSCNDIAYNTNTPVSDIIAVPHEGIRLIECRKEQPIAPERLAALQCESATEAARRIVTAIFDTRIDEAREALIYYDTASLQDTWQGYTYETTGEPLRSDSYNGTFVTIGVVTPRGEPATITLALRNDNPQRIWVVDGGL